MSRSVAGSFDNEAVAIFALTVTFYLFVRAVRSGSTMDASLAALGYLYMAASWGAYVFISNLIPLYVLAMIATRMWVRGGGGGALAGRMSACVCVKGWRPAQLVTPTTR